MDHIQELLAPREKFCFVSAFTLYLLPTDKSEPSVYGEYELSDCGGFNICFAYLFDRPDA